jgi:hypothetical protein
MTAKEFKDQIRQLIGGDKTDEAIEAMENRFKQEEDDDLLHIITVIKAEYKGLKNDVLKGVIDETALRQATIKIHNRLLAMLKDIDDKTAVHSPETIAACKAANGLLMYLSENTNSKTVFYEDANKNYWLRKAQGQAFIDALSEFSLVHGHGKHLPKPIKKDFYAFNGKVYRIIEKVELNKDDNAAILITNPDIKAFVTAIRQQIKDKLTIYL